MKSISLVIAILFLTLVSQADSHVPKDGDIISFSGQFSNFNYCQIEPMTPLNALAQDLCPNPAYGGGCQTELEDRVVRIDYFRYFEAGNLCESNFPQYGSTPLIFTGKLKQRGSTIFFDLENISFQLISPR